MTTAYETDLEGRLMKCAVAETNGMCVFYVLTEEKTTDELGSDRCSYSFFAALCGEGNDADFACVRDLTSERGTALEFFSLISDGAVTPCTLGDAAEDFAASL